MTLPFDRSADRSRPRWLGLTALGGLAIVATTACNPLFGTIDGSGTPETTTFQLGDFDEVEVTDSFEAEIAITDGPYEVEVTVDDNVVDHLDVEVSDGVLEVGFERGNYDLAVTPTVVIRVPDLGRLQVSGASDAAVTGIEGERFSVEASGASHASIAGSMQELSIEASGASDVVVDATAGRVELDGSGASHIDGADLTGGYAEVDLSGASTAELGRVDQIDGTLSGASRLATAAESDVSVRTSGASELE